MPIDEIEIEQEEGGEELLEKLKKVKEHLKLCLEEKQNYLTGWQRETAAFINYQPRPEEHLGEWAHSAGRG